MSPFPPLLSELIFTIRSAAPHSADLHFPCPTALHGNNTQKLLSNFRSPSSNTSLVKKWNRRAGKRRAHRSQGRHSSHRGPGCAGQAALTRKEESSFPGERALPQTPPCAPERISAVVRERAVLITLLPLPGRCPPAAPQGGAVPSPLSPPGAGTGAQE